jgi:hypothetical protein
MPMIEKIRKQAEALRETLRSHEHLYNVLHSSEAGSLKQIQRALTFSGH